VDEDLVRQTVELPGGELTVLQPAGVAEVPDDGAIEWAPVAPYWAVLWRSGVALARELDGDPSLRGRRVVELGCGLALPSIAAARRGAEVLATDEAAEGLELAERNAEANGVMIETARLDWTAPGDLVGGARLDPPGASDLASDPPFDLALAADVLYERHSVAPLLELLPRVAPEALLADPGRPPAEAFLDGAARRRWRVATRMRGVVRIHRFRFG
jgi:predicted nicotinamide N-methyase